MQRQNATWNTSQAAVGVAPCAAAAAGDVDPVQYLHDAVAEALSGTVPGVSVMPLRPAPDVTDISALGLRDSDGRMHDDPGTDCTAPRSTSTPRRTCWPARAGCRRDERGRGGGRARGLGLSEDQAAAARILPRTDRALTAFVGPAGTGKSHTLAAFAARGRAATGGRVIGLTLSTNASRVLASEGLAETHKIAGFLGKLEGTDRDRGHLPVHAGDVLVVDEATQVTTEDWPLQAVADRAAARVMVIGDMGHRAARQPRGGRHDGPGAREHGSGRCTRCAGSPSLGGPGQPAAARGRPGRDRRTTGGHGRSARAARTTYAARSRLWLVDLAAGERTLLLARRATRRPGPSRTTCARADR